MQGALFLRKCSQALPHIQGNLQIQTPSSMLSPVIPSNLESADLGHHGTAASQHEAIVLSHLTDLR